MKKKIATITGSHMITVDLWEFSQRRLNHAQMHEQMSIIAPLLGAIDCAPDAVGVEDDRWLLLVYKSSTLSAKVLDLFSDRYRLTEYAVKFAKDLAAQRKDNRDWESIPPEDIDPDDLPF